MSAAIDRALMALSLTAEDAPVDIPDLPQFSSSERNVLSIVGRILNPDCQNVSSLVQNLPRKWSLQGRVRGIALSRERFQFIFQLEDELEDLLKKGFQTFNEWGLAMERWSPAPPSDFLQSVSMWIQMKAIPMNHRTEATLMYIAETLGQVKVLAFDPEKSQHKEYVRVLVIREVSKPLIPARVFNLPGGDKALIQFHYERIQKRCYFCQRLIHEQANCPLWALQKEKETSTKGKDPSKPQKAEEPILTPSDPLFGVLEENQVGNNPLTGRPRINSEVLEGMRQYLLTANDEEKIIRQERIKKSLADIKHDPIAQKSLLSLEVIPLVTLEVDKGKGKVFDYSIKASLDKSQVLNSEDKLLSSAIKANATSSLEKSHPVMEKPVKAVPFQTNQKDLHGGSTGVFGGSFGASSSGTTIKSRYTRKRPGKRNRGAGDKLIPPDPTKVVIKQGTIQGGKNKRTQAEGTLEVQLAEKRTNVEVVPKEGLPEV